MNQITAVIGTFSRPWALKKQAEAIFNQSIKPAEIMVWQNGDNPKFPEILGVTHGQCNRNLGVWARFAFALNARTEYVAVFDDDTIPGRQWFQNCLDTMEEFNCLCGPNGAIFMSDRSYLPWVSVGWQSPMPDPMQADIVGHCWFFRREWLSLFWGDLPDIDHSPYAGEDFHFSWVLQKAGIPTYAPAHPPDNKDLWGSLEGKRLGASGQSIAGDKEKSRAVQDCLPYYVKKGFRLLMHGASEPIQV